MKSPGTVRGVPYTISAEEHPRSSLGAVRMPNSTQGSSCVLPWPELLLGFMISGSHSAIRTSYFVLRDSPHNFPLRCTLRGSYFAVCTSRFALRGSRPNILRGTGGLTLRRPHPINNQRFLCACAKGGHREGRELAQLATKLRISTPARLLVCFWSY